MTTFKMLARDIVALVLTMLIAWGCTQSDSPKAPKLQTLTFQLHWIPDTHQLGFWTALDKGFYRQNGLNVTIHPGGLDANPLRDVVSGSADVGQVGGIEQVCTAVSEGLPIKAIASIHRETPHALISLSTKPIRKPADFAGAKIAVAYGDTAEILLRTYMNEAHIPENSVSLVPFKFDLGPLLNGQVDAITGFSTGQPATLEKLGRSPVVLSYASVGVSSYGYTLVASIDTLAKKQSAIRKFLKASRMGWEYAFSHPDESIALLKKRFGDVIDEQLSLRELQLIAPLMQMKDGKLPSWKLDGTRVTGVLGYLQKQGQLKKNIPAASVYDNSLTE